MDVQNQNQQSEEDEQEDNIYEPSNENEDLCDYKVEGYHPVVIGETFNHGRYTVLQKLGYGYFSTVWLINEKNTQNYYALKVQKSKKSYSESALDEIQILECLRTNQSNLEWKNSVEELTTFVKSEFQHFFGNGGSGGLLTQELDYKQTFSVLMLDSFFHYGMHGKHQCSVFEILGPNLLDVISHFDELNKRMDLRLVKQITRQMLAGLDYIHRICGVIHTDIKPENVMLQLREGNVLSFAQQVSQHNKKPISMKFLDLIKQKQNKGKGSKNKSKSNKKKKDKKKQKKQQQQTLLKQGQLMVVEGDTDQSQSPNIISSSLDNTPVLLTQQQQQMEQSKNDSENIFDSKLSEGQNVPQQGQPIEINNSINNSRLPIQSQTQQGNQQKCQSNDEAENNGINMDQDQHAYTMSWKGGVRIPLDDETGIKLVDFGNACWINKHFTDNIQTREYRSPEAILGFEYGCNTDIFSLACLIFELITNDYLFKPKKKAGKYGKSDDHLGMMLETINARMPKAMIEQSKRGRQYFNKNGQLLRIKNLKESSISYLLVKNYEFTQEEADSIQQFLLPMLELDPSKRIQAREALMSKWLWL